MQVSLNLSIDGLVQDCSNSSALALIPEAEGWMYASVI